MALQSGSLGKVWLGPQTEKETAADTYYAFRANLVELAPAQLFRNIGYLVGGSFLLGDSIKTAAWGGGALVMPPVLDDYLGWLLYGFAGSCTSNDMGDSTYEHTFPSGADDTAPNLYLTGRRMIPGTANQYEQLADLRPTRILLGITPGEYVNSRFEFMGRTVTAPDGSGWAYSPKGQSSVPIACRGGLELPDGTSLANATAATLDITNVIPDLQRVLVVGDYYPYDFPVLGRNITLSYTQLYETNTLYQNFYWSGTAWTPTVYSTTMDVYVQSTEDITGASEPYEFKLWAANVQWSCEPIRMVGGDLVEFRITGTMAAATSGFDWYMRLKNGTASYTWPT